jgi:hypothetical protein
MELVARHPIAVREEHCASSTGFSTCTASRCGIFPRPAHGEMHAAAGHRQHRFRTGIRPCPCIGAIGGAHKMQLPLALSLLDGLPQRYGISFWSPDPLDVSRLPPLLVDQAWHLMAAGRLRQQPP